MTKKSSAMIVVAILITGSAGQASALDLPARTQAKTESLQGRLLDRTTWAVSVHEAVLPQAAEQLGASLEAAGFARPSGVTTRWERIADDTERRVILRLLEDTPVGSRAYRKDFESYRLHQQPLRYDRLAARALSASKAVRSQGGAEGLVAESVRHLSVGVGDADGPGVEELTVATMVILRRTLDGVPVLGRGGEVRVLFDADGTLTEVDLPLTEYVAQGNAAKPSTAGTGRLVDLLRKGGFSGLPAMAGGEVSRKGKPVQVASLECGYFDDGTSSALARGCVVHWSTARQSDGEFLAE